MWLLGRAPIQWLIIPSFVLFAAYCWRLTSTTSPPEPQEFRHGRNNTALFVVNDHGGFSNVHFATAQSLLEHHADIQIHVASHATLAAKCDRISSAIQLRQPAARSIQFHQLDGPTYLHATRSGPNGLVLDVTDEGGLLRSVFPAGVKGMSQLCAQMQILLDPWTAEEHLSLYEQALTVIDAVDPAVVVLDALFFPGVEAARTRKRVQAVISPNLASDTFASAQPRLGMLWKYPALGSGFSFPVPLKSILPNVYLNIRIITSILRMSSSADKRQFLASKGIQNAMDLTTLYDPNVPWITQTLPAAALPLDIIPRNVTLAGPILLSTAPARTQDPALMAWIDRAPTVLINLGTLFTYSITQAQQMAEAIATVLQKSNEVQILWKFTPSHNIKDRVDWDTAFIARLERTGRVKILPWLSVDPATLLLDSGNNIVAVVMHGGAGGYHEAIASGVPQIVLPLWADLYNFAQLAESKGVGLWACRETSPEWTTSCLAEAMLEVITASPRSQTLRAAAEAMKWNCTAHGIGRDIAGNVIARLARSGRVVDAAS